MKAALYCRVSTDKQETANQTAQLREFAKSQGWEIVNEYIDVISGSGKFRRPQFEQMLTAASQRKFFGFHNLRHSLASFLIRIRTDPKTVQTLLLHSDVKLTLQFYTHAVSRDRMAAAGKMLTAILSHAADQSGLKADCTRIAPA